MPLGALRTVLGEPHFRRLYATRLLSQGADGIFQASLAGAVLFNPEHSTDAARAAAAFAVLLLPYSLVGPFAGVLLDRWRRQRVLVVANLVRVALVGAVAALLATRGPSGAGFYLAALATVSVNRFFLAALSAALPHVVRPGLLVLGNSVSTTSGYVATIAGGGVALLVRAAAGAGDAGDAVVALLAAAVYLAAAAVAAGFRDPRLLGPEHVAAGVVLARLGEVLRGLRVGARHLLDRPAAAYALAAITAHRFCYGISTVATLLLYRNYFSDSGLFRAGLVGLGQVFVAGAVGVLAAAALTPAVARRIEKPAWITALFALAAGVEVALGLPYTQPTLLAAALLLGFVAQGAKICVDTIVQEAIDDDVRGRVFAFYDTLFNLAFVGAAAAGAVLLPPSGKSYLVLGLVSVGYAATATAYGAATGFGRRSRAARSRADAPTTPVRHGAAPLAPPPLPAGAAAPYPRRSC